MCVYTYIYIHIHIHIHIHMYIYIYIYIYIIPTSGLIKTPQGHFISCVDVLTFVRYPCTNKGHACG